LFVSILAAICASAVSEDGCHDVLVF